MPETGDFQDARLFGLHTRFAAVALLSSERGDTVAIVPFSRASRYWQSASANKAGLSLTQAKRPSDGDELDRAQRLESEFAHIELSVAREPPRTGEVLDAEAQGAKRAREPTAAPRAGSRSAGAAGGRGRQAALTPFRGRTRRRRGGRRSDDGSLCSGPHTAALPPDMKIPPRVGWYWFRRRAVAPDCYIQYGARGEDSTGWTRRLGAS